MALARSRRPGEDNVTMLIHESPIEVLEQFCLRQLRLQREVKRLDRLYRWEPRGRNARFYAVLLALCRFECGEID